MDLERLATALAAAGVGWCLGWLSARATDWLQAQDQLPLARHAPLVRDVVVQAGCAAAWLLATVFVDGPWYRWVAVGLVSVPLVQVTVTDLRHRYVYTLVAGAGIVLGVALGPIVHETEWWSSLAGAAGGFIGLGALYAIGRLMYGGREPLARGDVTIGAMVGAAAGLCTPSALFLGVLLGGVHALGVLLVRRQWGVYFAYGPGLCLGGLVSLFRC